MSQSQIAPSAPHQALYRRWRAQTFGEIVGQEATVTTLRNAVRTGKVAHALLFVGPRGTGKTSIARILAKALNCPNLKDGEPCDNCPSCDAIREGRALDVTEMDAASNNKVDDMRDLLPRIYTAPSDLVRKVFIVDEVQRITQGWDVLLKTLEEPPDHVTFIFCTTDASSVRPAVISRVQRFDFRRLSVDQIVGKLRRILDDAGRAADQDAIDLIATLAAGGMRDAESMLDQLLSSGSELLTGEQVRDLLGLADPESVARFIDGLVTGDALPAIAVLDDLEDRGRDPRAFLDQVLEAIRAQLVAGLSGRAEPDAPSPAELASAGRRLTAIDPARVGPGGLRFQLELALLAGAPTGTVGLARAKNEAAAVPAETRAVGPATAGRTKAAPSRANAPGSSRGEVPKPEPAPRFTDAPMPESAPSGQAAPPTKAAPSGQAAPPTKAAPSGPAARPVATPAAVGQEAPTAEEPAPPPPALEPAPPPPGLEPAPPPPGLEPVAANPEPAAATPEPVPSGQAASSSEPVEPSVTDGPLAQLLEAWPRIVADFSSQPALKPIIVESRPIAFEGNVVTLGFPEHKAFLKDVAERKKAPIEEGLARFFGRPVGVRCVATNLDAFPPLSADADSERLLAEARRIFADELVDVAEVD